MTTQKPSQQQMRRKDQKEIENGILKAITDITDEKFWPEDADAYDIQTIITQLARSAAHLRDRNTADLEKLPKNREFSGK